MKLYTMGNTGLLRREAEMTLLQPHLGDSRRQELRNSPFWPSPLFKSQLVKDGEEFLLKKSPLKNHRILDPIKTSPFMVPTIRKEAPTGNAPVGATPHKAVPIIFIRKWEIEQRLQRSFSTPIKRTRVWKSLPQ